jgi:hypothetical protein
MPQAKEQTPGDEPLPQQRDERGGVRQVQQERLGMTTPEDRGRAPKMPHERDETVPDASSANAEAAPGNEVMKRAHDDAASGKQDTSRGEATDAAYHQLRKG